jgi:chemotaxis protein CheD
MPALQEPTATELIVGVADCQATNRAGAVVTTYALGSCLGVTCYDPVAKVGGLLHAMLANSRLHHQAAARKAMFLDTGMADLVSRVQQCGGNPRQFEFKVFGGARVLQADEYFNIGTRNVQAMREIAAQFSLRIRVWEVGGQVNRTIRLHLADGRVRLRMPGQQEGWL